MKTRESLGPVLWSFWLFAVGSACGFFKVRERIGGFEIARFCACLVVISRTIFCTNTLLVKNKKTPVKTHCLSGLYWENFKTTFFFNIENTGNLIQGRTISPTFKGVIGNKYDKNTIKSASSLVTNYQKTRKKCVVIGNGLTGEKLRKSTEKGALWLTNCKA